VVLTVSLSSHFGPNALSLQVKYAKKSVSIAYHDKIQNFGSLPDGTIVLEETLDRPFDNYSKPIKCLNRFGLCTMGAPRSDHFHFTGRRKPWFHGPPGNVTEENSLDSAAHFWFYHLEQLNNELDMGLNFTGWTTGRSRRPLLGMYPKYGDVLTSNTNLCDDNKNQSMNATRHNLTSRYASVSHHAYGSLKTSATDTGTSNTDLAGTEKVEDGGDDDYDNDEKSIKATRHNLASSHVSVSHHTYGSLLTSADIGTGAVLTQRMSDHATTAAVTQNRANSFNSGNAATRARTTRSHHRHQHHRNSTAAAAALLNDRTISSEHEFA
jgi:hypothetical protein